MNIDKNLLKLLKQSRLAFILSLILGTLSAIAIILKAQILSQILDNVFLKNEVLSGILNLLILFAVISLLHFLFGWGKEWAASKTAEKIKTNLHKSLLDHIYKLGPVYTRSGMACT
jgi:ABC-type transport system involved in cytochrome bd biosynthesis fused ATPase/permease subunit